MKPRVGLIMPSSQVVTEPLFYDIGGAHADFVTSRVLLRGSGVAAMKEMEKNIPRAVEELASAKVDLLVSCCTSSGAIAGIDADREFCQSVRAATGIPMTSTMLSIVKVLNHLHVERLTVATPYFPESNRIEADYLTTNGFEVLAEAGQSRSGYDISLTRPQEIVDLATTIWDTRSDALLLSCMNWPTSEAATVLRDQLSTRVITSHTATLWDIAQALDIKGLLPIF